MQTVCQKSELLSATDQSKYRVIITLIVMRIFIAGLNISRHGIHFYFSIPRYAGEYVPDGRQFIVVAGNINYETVQVKLSYESPLKSPAK